MESVKMNLKGHKGNEPDSFGLWLYFLHHYLVEPGDWGRIQTQRGGPSVDCTYGRDQLVNAYRRQFTLSKVHEFINLCDQITEEANKLRTYYSNLGKPHIVDQISLLIQVVASKREQAIDNTLRSPSEGTGFGLTRMVGDWGWPDSPEGARLLDLCYELEKNWYTNF
jgi:hypothetical protein